jgi:hypothetical protein
VAIRESKQPVARPRIEHAVCPLHDASAHTWAFGGYRFFQARVKVFDEGVLGAGTFVTAGVVDAGGVRWERTEISIG